MTKEDLREIELKLISDEVICRVSLEQDTAIEFAELMEGGTVFPPIDVFERGDGSYLVGDGRTRLHAAGLAMRRTILCRVHPKAPAKEILLFAFKSNYGRGNPVTFEDARHTVMSLIVMKMARATIIESLPYPKTTSQRIYLQAFRNLVRKRCAAAVASMAKNPKLSLEDAARLHEIKVEELIHYTKGSHIDLNSSEAGRILQSIHQRGKAFTQFQAAVLRESMSRYQKGEMGSDAVRAILVAFDEETGRHRKNQLNWQNRFTRADGPPVFQEPIFTKEQTSYGLIMKPGKAS